MKTIKSKEILKGIEKVNHYSQEQFISDAKRYIKAIKERRVICSIGSVSSSGMSRTIKFLAPEKNKIGKCYNYYNFFAFFKALGYTPASSRSDYFRITGCGMDMIFHTNYSIIQTLNAEGLVKNSDFNTLCQQTPTTI